MDNDAVIENNADISTMKAMLTLFESFFENSFDYLIVFVPMFVVYKLCLKKYDILSRSKSIYMRFLKLYSFGTREEQVSLDANDNNENGMLAKNSNGSLVNSNKIEIKIGNNLNESSLDKQSTRDRILFFIMCFCGLQFSFLLWGLMQERIIKYGYSEASNTYGSLSTLSNEELLLKRKKFANFKNSQFLVLANRFAGLLLSLLILLIFNKDEFNILNIRKSRSIMKIVSIKNWPPLFICSYSSLSNVLSSWFQYESLKYVSFTTQLLAKSSKSVFVMLTGKVVSNKNYKLNEYISVCIIALGIFLFSDLNNQDSQSNSDMISTSLPGLLCLLGYLVTDSFTSTWQDSLIKEHKISSISLMFITNVYSCIYTFVSLLCQDELIEAIEFLLEHSEATYHVTLLSLTSAVGQIFIFLTIQNFGALVFSLIMTTRQVLSILLSSIIFQHQLSFQSCFGISLIFFALFLQQYYKFKISKVNAQKNDSLKLKSKSLFQSV